MADTITLAAAPAVLEAEVVVAPVALALGAREAPAPAHPQLPQTRPGGNSTISKKSRLSVVSSDFFF